jgi:RNA polymerase sigma factor (sigma-70 family)
VAARCTVQAHSPPRQVGRRAPTLTPLAGFHELPEGQLATLSDDRLIDYMRRARDAGRHDAMTPAIGVLVYGYWANLVGRARLKLPAADAEEVAGEAVASAIASAFDGKSIGEFRAWLHTILARRIADYLEARKRRPRTTPLPSEHQGEQNVWGAEPAAEFEGEALFAHNCLSRAYEEIDEPRHRRVVELYVLGPHAAAETAELVGGGMTEANVHQIASRFQRRFRTLLEEGSTAIR